MCVAQFGVADSQPGTGGKAQDSDLALVGVAVNHVCRLRCVQQVVRAGKGRVNRTLAD